MVGFLVGVPGAIFVRIVRPWGLCGALSSRRDLSALRGGVGFALQEEWGRFAAANRATRRRPAVEQQMHENSRDIEPHPYRTS